MLARREISIMMKVPICLNISFLFSYNAAILWFSSPTERRMTFSTSLPCLSGSHTVKQSTANCAELLESPSAVLSAARIYSGSASTIEIGDADVTFATKTLDQPKRGSIDHAFDDPQDTLRFVCFWRYADHAKFISPNTSFPIHLDIGWHSGWLAFGSWADSTSTRFLRTGWPNYGGILHTQP